MGLLALTKLLTLDGMNKNDIFATCCGISCYSNQSVCGCNVPVRNKFCAVIMYSC